MKKNLKDYLRITFFSDLIRIRDIKGEKLVCVGIEFLAFDVILRIKSEQKVIGNLFCAPMIFKNPLKKVSQ